MTAQLLPAYKMATCDICTLSDALAVCHQCNFWMSADDWRNLLDVIDAEPLLVVSPSSLASPVKSRGSTTTGTIPAGLAGDDLGESPQDTHTYLLGL